NFSPAADLERRQRIKVLLLKIVGGAEGPCTHFLCLFENPELVLFVLRKERKVRYVQDSQFLVRIQEESSIRRRIDAQTAHRDHFNSAGSKHAQDRLLAIQIVCQ